MMCAMELLLNFTCLIAITMGLSCSQGGYNNNQPQFGQECMYRCHCVNDVQCEYDTGECRSGCAAGWMGPGCQYGNIAYSKATQQKSNEYLWYSSSKDAVDDDISSCSQTSWLYEQWWRVDLNAMHRISGLVLRSDKTGNLKGFEVRVGNASSDSPSDYPATCFKHNITDELGEVIHAVCTFEQIAQHLMIWVPGKETEIKLCDVGVYGGRSLAYRRPATQISVSDEGQPYRSVDGGIITKYNYGTCTHTLEQPFPWWRVDLSQVFDILRMEIYNREDCCAERLSGFNVSFAVNDRYALVYKYPDTIPPEKTEVINFSSNRARFIEIGLPSERERALTLCEVFIYGDCPENYCGWSCESPCFCSGAIKKMDKIDGICPGGCAENWNGSKCNVCYIGRNDICDTFCGKCLQGSPCNASSRTCIEGCQPGWWKPSCNSTCNKCKENTTCTQREGFCSECLTGKWGHSCEHECKDCMEKTGCNVTNGNCLDGCRSGLFGVNCDQQCVKCSVDGSCSRNTGKCVYGCLPGWTNDNCSIECMPGYFGFHCDQRCGHCGNDSTCHHINGTCMKGCAPGYTGTTCNTVLESYGKHNYSEPSIFAAVGGVISALVLVSVATGLLLWTRRRLSSAKQQQNHQAKMKTIKSDDTSNTYENASILNEDPKSSPGKVKENETKLESVEICEHVHCSLEETLPETVWDTSSKESEMETYEKRGVYYNMITKGIRIEDLEDYVKKGVYLSKNIEQEYQGLISGPQYDMNVALQSRNHQKNRYKGMYAYDKTRVILDPLPDEPDSDYINACFIKGYKRDQAYIAAQGPTATIVNDFWRMVWQYNIEKIVMLTELYEQGKEKCHKYWPSTGTMQFGRIQVEIVDENICTEYTVRFLKVTRMGDREQKTVTQFHFTAWPDRDIPDSPAALVQFWIKVRYTYVSSDSPTLVHCSAGIGRTGTYIALDYLYDEGLSADSIHIFDCINDLRRQRVGMVQNVEQYVYLHRVLLEALVRSGKRVDVNDFPRYYQEMQGIDLKKGHRKLLVEFENLGKEDLFCPEKGGKPESAKDTGYGCLDECACANLPENRVKNRYYNIVPSRKYRPFLSSYVSGCNDYINAVCLPTRKNRNGLLLTQTPLPNTVVDFWRLVFEYDVQTLVMLNEETEPGENIGVYWPKGVQVCQFGPFTVKVVSETKQSTHTERILDICKQGQEETVKVTQFVYSVWKSEGSTPDSCSQFLNFLEKVDNWQRQSNNRPIITHCLNGADRSGLFCAIWCVLDKVKADREVAIRSVVRQMRIRRQQIVPNFEQYQFCHDIVLEYLTNSDTYTNVSSVRHFKYY